MLSADGIFIVVATVAEQDGRSVAEPEIIFRGVPSPDGAEQLRGELRAAVEKSLSRSAKDGISEISLLQTHLHDDLAEFVYRRMKRRPMVLPVVVEGLTQPGRRIGVGPRASVPGPGAFAASLSRKDPGKRVCNADGRSRLRLKGSDVAWQGVPAYPKGVVVFRFALPPRLAVSAVMVAWLLEVDVRLNARYLFYSRRTDSLTRRQGRIARSKCRAALDPPAEPECYDVFGVVAHEAGRSLGLDHSPDPTQTMADEFPADSSYDTRRLRTLGRGDIFGFRSLYPAQ